MSYDFHKLKTIQFSDMVSLRIPERWKVETRPELDWCCYEDGEETGTLYVKVDTHRRPEGKDSEPDLRNMIEGIAASFPEKFGHPALDTSIAEFQHGYLYKYACDFEENGELLWTVRYTIAQFHDDLLALIFINLVVPKSTIEDTEIKDLIGILDREVRAVELTLYSARPVRLPDFDELQTIKCGAALTLRVPARWNFETNSRDDEGWCCFREGEETGTLWISVNRFPYPTVEEDANFSLREFVDSMVKTRLENGSEPAIASEISEIESGYLWSYNFRNIENGEELHNYRYVFFQFDKAQFAVVMFNLVLLPPQIRDPHICELIAIVDREIRRTELSIFSAEAIAQGGVPFPLRKACSFGNKIFVSLPVSMKVTSESDRWYCYFDEGTVAASMWIMISDHRLSDDPFDEDGTIQEDVIDALARHFVDDPKDIVDFTRFAHGFLVHSVYDDDERDDVNDLEDPTDWRRFGFRHHLWRYFHIGKKEVRQAQFLLMLPVKEPNKRESISLVKILDHEIRRAEFPEF